MVADEAKKKIIILKQVIDVYFNVIKGFLHLLLNIDAATFSSKLVSKS